MTNDDLRGLLRDIERLALIPRDELAEGAGRFDPRLVIALAQIARMAGMALMQRPRH